MSAVNIYGQMQATNIPTYTNLQPVLCRNTKKKRLKRNRQIVIWGIIAGRIVEMF